jgi:SAM-dependent methyltransferase
VIDYPVGTVEDPLSIRVEGWVMHAAANGAPLSAVEVDADEIRLGRTSKFFPRNDAGQLLGFDEGVCAGFAILGSAPELLGRHSVSLNCFACFGDDDRQLIASSGVQVLDVDYRQHAYGILLDPAVTRVFHREDIYGSGPSVAEVTMECLTGVQRYLGPPPASVLDVGCGVGALGRRLLADGYNWLGVEVDAADCAELARLNLPHQLVDGKTLPFDSAAFDASIAIEVLEHVADPAPFLEEIRRVTRRRVIFSVPNLELLAYLGDYGVVPWHLLEGDHKNFFSRASLQHLLRQYFRNVEVLSYGLHQLRGPRDIPLHVHLLAVADV